MFRIKHYPTGQYFGERHDGITYLGGLPASTTYYSRKDVIDGIAQIVTDHMRDPNRKRYYIDDLMIQAIYHRAPTSSQYGQTPRFWLAGASDVCMLKKQIKDIETRLKAIQQKNN